MGRKSMTLNELIKQAAEDYETADPRELARFVAKAAPEKQLRELFAEAIVDDCRQFVMGQRNKALTAARRRPNYSPKLAQRRAWWPDFLAASEHVGKGIRKQLGDCTIVDLQFAIDERKTNIARIQGYIDIYELLIPMMQSHNVTHVRDLPPEVVESGLAA